MPVELDETVPECGLVATENRNIFAGARRGVYHSDDGGVTWTLAGLGQYYVYELEYSADGSLWTIACRVEDTCEVVLLRSDDGSSWTLVADEDEVAASAGGLPPGRFEEVAISPEGDIYISAVFDLVRSQDGGESWETINIDPAAPGTVPTSSVLFAPDGVAYVGAGQGFSFRNGRGTYRSTDGGLTWAQSEPTDLVVNTIVAAGGALLAGTDSGLYRSVNGLMWEPSGVNNPARRVLTISPEADGAPTMIGTDRGVYLSQGNSTWNRVNEGFERGLTVRAVTVDSERLFASANGEVYRFDPTDERWVLPANAGLSTNIGSTVVPYDGALLAGASSGLFRSDDQGGTWEPLWLASGEEERFARLAVTFTGDLILGTVYSSFSAQIGQLFTSSDEGATWDVIEGWDSSVGGIPAAIVETPTGTLLVAAIAGKFNPTRVYRSTNGGTSWSDRGVDGTYSLAITPGGTIVGVGGGGHYRSVDDGMTWEQVVSGGGGGVIAAPNGGLAVIRGSSRDIYYSVDDGVSWTQVSEELTASTLTTDEQSFVYAGTAGQGVFRSPGPLFVGNEDETEASPSLVLASGYPNPAAASTRIPFTLSEAGSATVTVHDVLGRRVATLMDGVLPAGEHVAVWDAQGVASGVYVVTLRARGQVATQRIAVTR